MHFFAIIVFLMAFVGGAVIPLIQNFYAQHFGTIASFHVIIGCYSALILITLRRLKKSNHGKLDSSSMDAQDPI